MFTGAAFALFIGTSGVTTSADNNKGPMILFNLKSPFVVSSRLRRDIEVCKVYSILVEASTFWGDFQFWLGVLRCPYGS